METGISLDNPEMKRDLIVSAVIVKDSLSPTDQLLTYFSSWQRLKVSVPWFLKVKRALLKLRQARKELTSDPNNPFSYVQLEMKKVRKTLGGAECFFRRPIGGGVFHHQICSTAEVQGGN